MASKAAQEESFSYLNAGRGNPNWVATEPREAFFLLGQFAVTESKRVLDLPPGVGGMPKAAGIAGRLEAWLTKHEDMPGAPFLQAMVPWAVKKFGFDPDKFVHELVDSIIGDHYPVPDRMLVHNEQIVHEYLEWAMCGDPRPKGKFKIYAVEGGTAAMCYIFKSLKSQPDSQSRRHDRARRADLHAVPRDGAPGGLRPPFRRGAREAGGSVSVSG